MFLILEGCNLEGRVGFFSLSNSLFINTYLSYGGERKEARKHSKADTRGTYQWASQRVAGDCRHATSSTSSSTQCTVTFQGYLIFRQGLLNSSTVGQWGLKICKTEFKD